MNLLEKNILDLQFQKNLVIASTTVVIAFTYLIGVAIAFVTDQINVYSVFSFATLLLMSGVVLVPCLFFFSRAYEQIRIIPVALQAMKH